MPHLLKHQNPDHGRGVEYDAAPSEAPQPRPLEGGGGGGSGEVYETRTQPKRP